MICASGPKCSSSGRSRTPVTSRIAGVTKPSSRIALLHLQRAPCAPSASRRSCAATRRRRRARRNHRAHERLRIGVIFADADARRDLGEALDEAVAERVVRHEETARARAALPGRQKRRLNRVMHGGIDVRHRPITSGLLPPISSASTISGRPPNCLCSNVPVSELPVKNRPSICR